MTTHQQQIRRAAPLRAKAVRRLHTRVLGRLTLGLAGALVLLCGCARPSAPVAAEDHRTVSFPRVALAAGERMDSVEVVIGCARFTSIQSVPNDWSIEVVGPESEVSTLKASAGHGSTGLWSSRDLDDFFTLWVVEPSCFSIKGTATAFTADKERTISFTQADFVMRPSKRAAAREERRAP